MLKKLVVLGISIGLFQPLILEAKNKSKLGCQHLFVGFTGVASRVANPAKASMVAESLGLDGLDNPVEPPKSVKQVTPENLFDIAGQSSGVDPSGTGNERWIKFIAFRNKKGTYEIEFQNSISQRFHEEFLRTKKGFESMPREEMEKLALTGINRPILFGTLLSDKLSDADLYKPPFPWKFEIVTADSIPFNDVKQIHELVSANAKKVLKGPLKYKPVAQVRDEVAQNPSLYQQAGIVIEFPKPALGRIVYTPGWSIGRIKRVKAADLPALMAQDKISPEDILVLDELPRELPSVAGVITGAESSPNSHVALLAQMRGTVFFYEHGAYESADWKRIESAGSPIFLQAGQVGIRKQESLTDSEAKELTQFKVRAPIGKISVNRTELEIKPGEVLKTKDIPAYGAKAVNYGLLRRLLGDAHTEASLGIPLGHFEIFKTATQASGKTVGSQIQTLLESIASPSTPNSVVSQSLAQVRNLITGAENSVPTSVLETIQSKLLSHFPKKKKVKLRSSSPIEDLREFNGAGLYDSFGVKIKDLASIEEGLRAVWASFYNDRAYFARREFGLDQTQGSMAVQVNPTFKGELANGVMIYGVDPYGQKRLIVTGFPGEDLEVTNPPIGKRPETAEVVKYSDMEPEVYLRTPSTELPTERMLLDKSEYAKLFEIGDMTSNAWKAHTGNSKADLDFEWKLILGEDGKRKVIVKQVREVPPPPVTQLQKLKDTFVLPSRNLPLLGDIGENSDGLLGLISKQLNLLPSLSSFKLNSDLKAKNPIEELTVSLPSGAQVKLKGSEIKSEFTQSPWKTNGNNFGGTGNANEEESRTKEWKVQLVNSEIPSLSLTLSLTERRLSKGASLESPILMLGDLGMALEANTQEIPFLKFSRTDLPRDKTLHWRVHVPEHGIRFETRVPYKVTADFKGTQVSASLEGSSSFGGVDKTFFADLLQAKVVGLTSQPLEIIKSSAMTHAPAHHNFSWSVAFDLFQAKNIDPKLKEELESKGGRYLIFEGGMSGFVNPNDPTAGPKVWLINEKGDWTDVGGFQGDFMKGSTPISGGG